MRMSFQRAQEKTKDLVIDLLTVIGQADVALTQAREATLHPQLDKGFVASLKMLNKTRGGDSSRFKANRLFHEHLDTVVTRRSKEAKLDGVLASSGQGCTAQGRGRWNKEPRWIMCLSITLIHVWCNCLLDCLLAMPQVWCAG